MTNAPTRPETPFYDQGPTGIEADSRLFSAIALRNSPPMIAALTPHLADRTGPVIEIGAGTGQHAAAFSLAFPNLSWWASDPVDEHRTSISAWADFLHAPGLGPLDIDAASLWSDMPEVAKLGPLTAVLSMNVIHIAPIEVVQGLIREAGRVMARNGLLIFYGPFFVSGDPISAGNAAFDQRLKARNSTWGIRDTEDLGVWATEAGFSDPAIQPMPANNRLVIFRKIG